MSERTDGPYQFTAHDWLDDEAMAASIRQVYRRARLVYINVDQALKRQVLTVGLREDTRTVSHNTGPESVNPLNEKRQQGHKGYGEPTHASS